MKQLHQRIAECQLCRTHLPWGPRPVVQFSRRSRVVIVGQAPGKNVHETGIPWDDPSGDHLRQWLDVTSQSFYDPDAFALVPMGFCYPGKRNGGDAPPRPECAPQWHGHVFRVFENEPLVILCGLHAVRHYLGSRRKNTLTGTVRSFNEYGLNLFPLPHPSWRSRTWMKRNPWFEETVLPALRRRVRSRLTGVRTMPSTPKQVG